MLEEIPNDSAAALLLIEHHWAVPLRDAIARAGGFRIGDGFISPLDLIEIGLVSADDAKSSTQWRRPPSAARNDPYEPREVERVRRTKSGTAHKPSHRTPRVAPALIDHEQAALRLAMLSHPVDTSTREP